MIDYKGRAITLSTRVQIAWVAECHANEFGTVVSIDETLSRVTVALDTGEQITCHRLDIDVVAAEGAGQ